MGKFLKNLVKKITPVQAFFILTLALIGFFVIYFYDSTEENSYQQETEEFNIAYNESPMSKEEVILEGAKEGIEIIEEVSSNLVKNKRIKDSIYEANRNQYWAYRISDHVNSKESILMKYLEIDLDQRSLVKIFQSKDKSYFLFVKPDLHNSESALRSSIKSYQAKFGSGITIINLINGKKCDKVVEINHLKKRINKVRVVAPCFICE